MPCELASPTQRGILFGKIKVQKQNRLPHSGFKHGRLGSPCHKPRRVDPVTETNSGGVRTEGHRLQPVGSGASGRQRMSNLEHALPAAGTRFSRLDVGEEKRRVEWSQRCSFWRLEKCQTQVGEVSVAGIACKCLQGWAAWK
eukprot:Gb_33459 [translate_table: standard]